MSALTKATLNEAVEHVQQLVDFAYEQGFHEIGFDAMLLIRSALALRTEATKAEPVADAREVALGIMWKLRREDGRSDRRAKGAQLVAEALAAQQPASTESAEPKSEATRAAEHSLSYYREMAARTASREAPADDAVQWDEFLQWAKNFSAENERWPTARDAWDGALADRQRTTPLTPHAPEAADDAVRQDAERYRWLRHPKSWLYVARAYDDAPAGKQDLLDAAIDAAMQAETVTTTCEVCGGSGYVLSPDDGLTAVECPRCGVAKAVDKRDAARYRWLRDRHIGDDPESISLRAAKRRGLDAAIDEAMK